MCDGNHVEAEVHVKMLKSGAIDTSLQGSAFGMLSVAAAIIKTLAETSHMPEEMILFGISELMSHAMEESDGMPS